MGIKWSVLGSLLFFPILHGISFSELQTAMGTVVGSPKSHGLLSAHTAFQKTYERITELLSCLSM